MSYDIVNNLHDVDEKELANVFVTITDLNGNTIAFSSGIAFNEGYFVSMDIAYNSLKKRMKRIVDIFNQGVMIVLFIVISVFSVQFILMGQNEPSASLGLEMSFAFTSILVMALSLSFYGIDQLYKIIKDKK